MVPPDRGHCNHVLQLGNGGKSVDNCPLLNASLGRQGTDVKTLKRYLLTTAFDPTRCGLTCKHVKPDDGPKENPVQFENTVIDVAPTTSTRAGPVGIPGKRVLRGSTLAESLGFIEHIPHKSSVGSQEWHHAPTWQDAPMPESRPLPSREYRPATPQPNKSVPDRSRARLNRKRVAAKKREARARQVFRNGQKEMLKFKVKFLCPACFEGLFCSHDNMYCLTCAKLNSVVNLVFNANFPLRMERVHPPLTQLPELSTHRLKGKLPGRGFLTPISPNILEKSNSPNPQGLSSQFLPPKKLMSPNCSGRKPTDLNTFRPTTPLPLGQWDSTTSTKIPPGRTGGVLGLAACEVAPNTAFKNPLPKIKSRP